MGSHVRVIADARARGARAFHNLQDSAGSWLQRAGNRARVDVQVRGHGNHRGREIPDQIEFVTRRTIFCHVGCGGRGAIKPRALLDQRDTTARHVGSDDLTPGIRTHPGCQHSRVSQASQPNSDVHGAAAWNLAQCLAGGPHDTVHERLTNDYDGV